MNDFATFFLQQAQASDHIHFIYDVAAQRVVFVNAAYEQVLLGHCPRVNEELPALLARLHPDDRPYLAPCWARWQQGRLAHEVEVRLLSTEGAEQWFCLTPFYLPTPDGAGLIGGTLRDRSASKRYQQNADTFNTKKNATLEILSHDLSNAFVLVQQIGEYLHEEVAVPEGSRVAEMLRVLATTSRDSVQMIRDFVNLEFLSSANTDLQRQRVEVGTTLRAPLEELQRAQALLGHPFTYSLPPEPVYAQLDVNKMTQVVTNLISNAIKFTPDGKRVDVQIESRPGRVRIQVRDEGVGIPQALLPHLFERFTKARRPGLRGEPTTGLGLALCQTIVEWHQGTLSVESIEGQGTAVTVEIPLADEPAEGK